MRAVDKYAVLRERVRLLFEEGGRVWGYRTIHAMQSFAPDRDTFVPAE